MFGSLIFEMKFNEIKNSNGILNVIQVKSTSKTVRTKKYITTMQYSLYFFLFQYDQVKRPKIEFLHLPKTNDLHVCFLNVAGLFCLLLLLFF